jgi:hypothetical protein
LPQAHFLTGYVIQPGHAVRESGYSKYIILVFGIMAVSKAHSEVEQRVLRYHRFPLRNLAMCFEREQSCVRNFIHSAQRSALLRAK